MPFKTEAVANHILRLAWAEGEQITALKLQKLVYFAHGWYLGMTGKPLINHTIEAWKHGPVVPNLYRAVRQSLAYPTAPIEKPISIVVKQGEKYKIVVPDLSGDDAETQTAIRIVRWVWGIYKRCSAIELVGISHEAGGPWHRVWEPMSENPIMGTDIPNADIASYFRGELERMLAANNSNSQSPVA